MKKNNIMKDLARRTAISMFSAKYSVSGEMSRLLCKNRVQFIYFHQILSVQEARFRELLSFLMKDHVFLGHSEALARIHSGSIDKPYLSVSFDDGFKNCLKAASIMDDYGIKACFFVTPYVIGEKDPSKLKVFCREKLHSEPAEFLDWDDIDTLLSKGHEIGSHGMTHSCLAGIDRKDLDDEITGSFLVLDRRAGPVKHFSWPYGRFSDFSPEAARTVFDAGFVSCSSAVRGCHTFAAQDKRALCIRRDHIMAEWPLSHIKYFLAKSSGASSEKTGRWPEAWIV